MTYGISLGLRPLLQNKEWSWCSLQPFQTAEAEPPRVRAWGKPSADSHAVIWRPGPGQSDLFHAVLARETARMSLGSHHLEGWGEQQPCARGSQAIHSRWEVLETWTYVIFPLIYFPLLALALIQVAQGKGCHRGRQRKGQSFPGFCSSKASPFRGMERPPGTCLCKSRFSWAPTTPPDYKRTPRAAGRHRVSIDTPRRYMWVQFQATTMKWVTWIFWFPDAYESYVYTYTVAY